MSYGNFNSEDSTGNYNPKYHYQAAQNAGFATGGDDTSPRTLYVGNLDPSVTEEFIATLFGQIGVVTKSKVIFDGTNDPYAFVEFQDNAMAQQALQAMNKRCLLEKEMKVNWATEPGQQGAKVDTSKHFHVFIGDLSPEIDNKMLKEAFASFGEISDSKVIRDPTTLKSKGYGFVSYPKREEAERAIEQMNGQWIGRRAIRTNWATRKPTDPSENQHGGGGRRNEQTFDEVYNQTSPENTSVYIGNVDKAATEEDIREAFGRFGRILEVRVFKVADKPMGYSFVKFETKDSACRAIVQMQGHDICGTSVKCSWGKTDYQKSGATGAFNPPGQGGFFNGPPQSHSDNNPYSNYGNGAYGAGNAAAAQQHYWQYYQQYYNNPQLMQQWAQYYQSQAAAGGGPAGPGGPGGPPGHPGGPGGPPGAHPPPHGGPPGGGPGGPGGDRRGANGAGRDMDGRNSGPPGGR